MLRSEGAQTVRRWRGEELRGLKGAEEEEAKRKTYSGSYVCRAFK